MVSTQFILGKGRRCELLEERAKSERDVDALRQCALSAGERPSSQLLFRCMMQNGNQRSFREPLVDGTQVLDIHAPVHRGHCRHSSYARERKSPVVDMGMNYVKALTPPIIYLRQH